MGQVGRLAAVTAGVRPAGVYRWLSRAHVESVRRNLAAAGWSVHVLDGRAVTGPQALFDRCARVLAFPTWFGHNWDALVDCLGDLSWLPGKGHVLLWEQYGVLARTDPAAWRTALGVFAAVAETRRAARVAPLYVLLRGAGPTDSVPAL